MFSAKQEKTMMKNAQVDDQFLGIDKP